MIQTKHLNKTIKRMSAKHYPVIEQQSPYIDCSYENIDVDAATIQHMSSLLGQHLSQMVAFSNKTQILMQEIALYLKRQYADQGLRVRLVEVNKHYRLSFKNVGLSEDQTLCLILLTLAHTKIHSLYSEYTTWAIINKIYGARDYLDRAGVCCRFGGDELMFTISKILRVLQGPRVS